MTIAFLLSGCASIVSKTFYPIYVRTNPSNASVVITDKTGKEVFKGESPTTVYLKSGAGFFTRAEYQVRIGAPGYNEQTIPVTYKINGWYWGNILIGGLIGMLIVDPATGAMWKLATPPLDITLNKATASEGAPALKILTPEEVPPYLKGNLIPIK